MLLQKIFLCLKDKYSISMNEIDDLFDIEEVIKDCKIYDNISVRYESVLKVKFEAVYFEAKRLKNRLHSFLKIYLWKKAINSEIQQDLYMNDLTTYNDKFLISILEKNTIYKFRLSDIVNLWMLSLKKTDQLFVVPMKVKNPYTNIEFSKSTLYNIYLKILDTGFIIPSLITSHIQYELDIKMFTIRNYPELKELAILTFMREGSYIEKYEHIINMLHDYRRDINYYTMSSICSNTVQKRAVKIFSNHLFLYLESKFSCNPMIKAESNKRVKEKLKKLLEDEPLFGFDRGDVVRYVPISERAEQRRIERDNRLSPRPPPGLTPPPLPNTMRRRRRNAITARPAIPLVLPPPPPPPPPPQTNTIVRNYVLPSRPPPLPSTTNTRLPPLLLNNFTYNLSTDISRDIPDSNTTSSTTTNPTPPSVNISSTNTPEYISNLLNSRNRARDLLQQIDTVLNETSEPEPLPQIPESTSETPEEEVETDDEFSNEFGFDISYDLENPFTPRSELNRTPPPNNALREPLLRPIHNINTQQMINRINAVIDREIFNSYEDDVETSQTPHLSVIEDVTTDDATTDEATTDEVTTDEATTDEATTDEATTDDETKDNGTI